MALWSPQLEYRAQFCSVAGTRPFGGTAIGTSITPGNNTKGSYSADIITSAQCTFDVYAVQIQFNGSSNANAQARDTIVDIGCDPAGGTSYSVWIPDLLATCAGFYTGPDGGAINYYFPLWAKAGSSFAARASINNSTVGTLRCWLQIFGKPSRRHRANVCTKVIAYGVSAGTSNGTSITSGETDEGAWTDLGTVGSGERPWYWQFGLGTNDTTMSSANYIGDFALGDASNKRVIQEQQRHWRTTSSEIMHDLHNWPAIGQAAPGDHIYGRLQCSGTPSDNLSMIAYGAY